MSLSCSIGAPMLQDSDGLTLVKRYKSFEELERVPSFLPYGHAPWGSRPTRKIGVIGRRSRPLSSGRDASFCRHHIRTCFFRAVGSLPLHQRPGHAFKIGILQILTIPLWLGWLKTMSAGHFRYAVRLL